MRFLKSCRFLTVAIVGLLLTSCASRTPASPSQAAPFTISGVDVTAPYPYADSCPVTLSFPTSVKGQARQTGAYQFTYQLEWSDGSKGQPVTAKVYVTASEEKSFSFANQPYDVTFRTSASGSVRMRVTDPNDVSSTEVPLSVTCVPK